MGSEVLEEVHLEPAGQVVQVSVAPGEYEPLPQAISAVAPIELFARYPGVTVSQPVTYFVVCSIAELARECTLRVLRTATVCSFWTESALSRVGSGISTGATGVTVLAVWAEVPSCAGLTSCGIVLARAASRVGFPLEACDWFVKEQTPATAA